MTRVVSENPQNRPGTVKQTWYRPDKRELSATVRWSLESADARDEIRQTVDHKKYINSLPKGREYVATVKWSLESSDAREEVKEIRRSRTRQPFSVPERLPRHLDYLPPAQVTFDWGYGYFSPNSLYSRLLPASEPPPEPVSPVAQEPGPSAIRTTDRSGYTLPPGPYDAAEPNVPLQALIGQAILSSKDRCLTLREISSYICTVYPFYSVSSDDAAWMKNLSRKVNSSYFFIIPQDRSDKRKVNLYSIADKDLPLFANGGFEFRKRAAPKRKSRAFEAMVQAKKPRVSESISPTPSPEEEEDMFFPPAPRSRTQSLSPPPAESERALPPRRSYQSFSLKPSASLPTLPFYPSKKLVPVHSWHQPPAYRMISPGGAMHDRDSDP
ncbi:hypothetical protein BDZ89DRAFT_1107610 [Hymenopellis radicata]|nr:hypothetical protein BDZ89DRAFT_1107610 [Hymenopellis radicata]